MASCQGARGALTVQPCGLPLACGLPLHTLVHNLCTHPVHTSVHKNLTHHPPPLVLSLIFSLISSLISRHARISLRTCTSTSISPADATASARDIGYGIWNTGYTDNST